MVAPPGLEPRNTEPKSGVLPITLWGYVSLKDTRKERFLRREALEKVRAQFLGDFGLLCKRKMRKRYFLL